jgi:hypothetical protein
VAIAVRTCSAKNKAGAPCGATPMRDSDYCNVHDPDSPVASRFLAGPNHTNGPGAPSKFDQWRDEVMAEWGKWVRPYLAARDSDDPALGMKAGEFVFDRLWGKATQPVEHSGGFDVAAFFGVDPLQPTDSLPEEAS